MRIHKYTSYTRIHNYEYPYDEEKSKIRREVTNYLKALNAREVLAKRILKEALQADVETDYTLYDSYQERSNVAEREKNNAKAHKRRLKELEETDEDFS